MDSWAWLNIVSVVITIAWQGIFALSYYFIMRKISSERANIALLGFVPWLGYIAILYAHFATLNILSDKIVNISKDDQR